MASKKKAAKAKSPSKPAKKTAAKPAGKSLAKKVAKARSIVKTKKSASKASKPASKKVTPKKVVKPVKSTAKKTATKKPLAKKVVVVKKAVVKKSQAKAAKSAGTKSVLNKQIPQKNIQSKLITKPQQPPVQKITPAVTRTKPEIKSPYTGQMPQTRNMNIEKNTDTRSRYSDAELKEFKVLVERKLEDARAELINLNAAVINANENGTDDTGASFKMLEDGSDTLAKEESAQLAIRQKKFIDQLEAALQRIDNKTYGICRVTGKLIAKERLRAVPHTTQSMEAKLKQYRE